MTEDGMNVSPIPGSVIRPDGSRGPERVRELEFIFPDGAPIEQVAEVMEQVAEAMEELFGKINKKGVKVCSVKVGVKVEE